MNLESCVFTLNMCLVIEQNLVKPSGSRFEGVN